MRNQATIRTSALALLAAGLALPLIATAAATPQDGAGAQATETLFYDRSDREVISDAETLYARLQDKSREICGPASVRVTGSLRRATGNEACYEGTLAAAVERLDDPAITALHEESAKAL